MSLKSIDSKNKVGIIVGTGDRKDSDVIELGKISAQMFDHILIHQVKFLRGKTAIELIDLLVQGINSENSGTTWERVADDVEPLKYALSKAKEGSFICALSDVLDKPIELVSEYKKEF
jgi:cyanophycin synthetase